MTTKNHLIVLRKGNQKHQGRDIVETVNPFASLGPLSANINHSGIYFWSTLGAR